MAVERSSFLQANQVALATGGGFKGFLGQPGYIVADALGASVGGILWWAIMVVNSLVWGAVLSLFVFPFIRKVIK